MFGFGVKFHRTFLSNPGLFDGLTAANVTRTGAKPRWDADLNIVEDATNTLGQSYDPATGDRLGLHIGGQVTRLNAYPEMDANWNAVGTNTVLTPLTLDRFGRTPGLLISSDGVTGGARIGIGALTAGQVISGSFIYEAAASDDSGRLAVVIVGDGNPVITGERGSLASNSPNLILLGEETWPDGRGRVDWQYTVQADGSFSYGVSPNEVGGAIVGLLAWVESPSIPSPLPPLSSPGSQVTQLADDVFASLPGDFANGRVRIEASVSADIVNQPSGTTPFVARLTDAALSNRIDTFFSQATNRFFARATVAGVNTSVVVDAPAASLFDLSVSVTADAISLTVNGDTVSTALADGPPLGMDELYVGSSNGTISHWAGGLFVESLIARAN